VWDPLWVWVCTHTCTYSCVLRILRTCAAILYKKVCQRPLLVCFKVDGDLTAKNSLIYLFQGGRSKLTRNCRLNVFQDLNRKFGPAVVRLGAETNSLNPSDSVTMGPRRLGGRKIYHMLCLRLVIADVFGGMKWFTGDCGSGTLWSWSHALLEKLRAFSKKTIFNHYWPLQAKN